MWVQSGCGLWLCLPDVWRVHWVQACKRSGFVLAFVVCSVSFPLLLPAFLLCVCRVACKYGFISHFKGVFRGFYGVRVGLCCLGGLGGFCARVELGGLEACCVFAFLLSFFLL